MLDELLLEVDFGSTIGEKDSDYILEKVPKPAHTFEPDKIQYNQNLVNAYSCTLFGAMGCISDLTNFRFPIETQKEIFQRAVNEKNGLDPKKGWSLSQAVDRVRNDYNSTAPNKVLSFRLTRNSTKFWETLKMGYSMALAFRGNSKYNTDKNDGKLDGTNFGLGTYGHIIRIFWSLTLNKLFVVDNYLGGKMNIYEIPEENWDKLSNFYDSAYVFVDEKDYRALNADAVIPTWGVDAWAKYNNLFDNPNANAEISQDQWQWLFHKLGYIEKPNEPMTQLRFTVLIKKLLTYQ